MTKGPVTYEQEFTVGPVRVTLWKDPYWNRDPHSPEQYQWTLDRGYTDFTGQFRRSDVLKAEDIPKAILALKQAYDYITRQGKAQAESRFREPDIPIPQRIP